MLAVIIANVASISLLVGLAGGIVHATYSARRAVADALAFDGFTARPANYPLPA